MFISSDGVNVPTDKLCHFKLFVFHAKGNMKHQSHYNFFKKMVLAVGSQLLLWPKIKMLLLPMEYIQKTCMSVIAVGNLTTAILWMNFMQDSWAFLTTGMRSLQQKSQYRNFVYISTETGKNLMIRWNSIRFHNLIQFCWPLMANIRWLEYIQ